MASSSNERRRLEEEKIRVHTKDKKDQSNIDSTKNYRTNFDCFFFRRKRVS